MTIKTLWSAVIIALAAIAGMNVNAANIDINTARSTASSFLKVHSATVPGSFRAPALGDLKLAHAEASSTDPSANTYYAFNIEGGGFIIVAGDDRASQVLGYSDTGSLDFDNIPETLTGLLNDYKVQIEYLQAHPSLNVPKRLTSDHSDVIIEPLLDCTWGQLMPYYLQCPQDAEGRYSKVGCAGVQMAQVVYYWKYPVVCGPLDPYYCSALDITMPQLPVTTFDYSLMLPSYCHWDSNLREPVMDIFTEEQVQEAAKLCLYVGQAAKMNYSPTGSSTISEKKMKGMKALGLGNSARAVNFSDGYTFETWEPLLKTELNAGRPIMYSAKNNTSTTVSHAFVVDGYTSDNYFHINLGWYGVSDGWFLLTAIEVYTLDGEYRNYGSNHYVYLNINPPTYCKVRAKELGAQDGLLLLGETLQPQATRVNVFTNYNTVALSFTLADQEGNQVVSSDPINVTKNGFVQNSDISSSIVLPLDLATGTYDLQFNYTVNDDLTTAVTADGKLYVAGRLAKYNRPFGIQDVTPLIDRLLSGDMNVNITDVTALIGYLLNH